MYKRETCFYFYHMQRGINNVFYHCRDTSCDPDRISAGSCSKLSFFQEPETGIQRNVFKLKK